jgi:hypothetical protein
MTFKAFVYGWRHIVTGKMYIGFRKNSDVNDGYIFSSEDEELREAWSLGLLRRCILFRGSFEDAITHERKLLKYADARRNQMFYNKSNGGGAGIRDYNTITDEEAKVGIDWINGIDPVEDVEIFDFIDTKLVDVIFKNVKNNKYKQVEVSVSEILTYKQNQVRLNMIDHNHMSEIAEYMLNDSKEARANISPIIVVVDAAGEKTIIDGNHTSRAVEKAGWTVAPVIFLNSSEFNDNQSNIDHFGVVANHIPKKRKGNKPEDCQRHIINLYVNNLAYQDDEDLTLFKDVKFKNTCLAKFNGYWTNKMIVNNLDKAITRYKTDRAIATMNFQLYSKKDLDRIAKQVEATDPTLAVITVTSGSVYNSGIGGVMNKMGGLKSWHGIIIVHHSNVDEYENWKDSEAKLKESMLRMNEKCKVKYVVLNSFKKQTKVKV